jgi:hypothetical protein
LQHQLYGTEPKHLRHKPKATSYSGILLCDSMHL